MSHIINLESLQRKFAWDSPCSTCGQPAVLFEKGVYLCRSHRREREAVK